MPWQELTFELEAGQMADYEDALISLGALSVTLRDAADQPLLEPPPQAVPLWDKLLLTAMFESNIDIDTVAQQLKGLLQLETSPDFKVSLLEDREWRRTWMDYFEPIKFGRRLWICPSGYEHPQQDDAVIIDLDPGLAFGTGSHPTTALCLQWLDANSVVDKVVVDFGCGSGVLAIAAAKLGAARVFAVDNDSQALLATQQNAENNQVSDLITLCDPAEISDASIDIVLANILLQPLLSLRVQFTQMLKPSGKIVLSGLLDEHKLELEKAYSRDFTLETCQRQKEWVRFSGIRH